MKMNEHLISRIFSGNCSKWTLQVLHWSLHTTLGYILMMAVMTYNGYISIALVIGGCLGYWIFGPTLVQSNMQQFHRKQAIVECDKNCEGISILYYIGNPLFKLIFINLKRKQSIHTVTHFNKKKIVQVLSL